MEVSKMTQEYKLHQYFYQWMQLYKLDAVREVTYKKYEMTHRQLRILAPDLELHNISRLTYQQLLNDYAETHERQTVMDFHRHVKSSLVDALEEGLIDRDQSYFKSRIANSRSFLITLMKSDSGVELCE
jgi:hypothetical protein